MAEVIKLPRQPDGEAFYLHFTGGFRAAKVSKDAWQIEPVLINREACSTGPLTMEQLQTLAKQTKLRAIAFQQMGWMKGVYYSRWAPVVPGKTNHLEGPAELWSNIASNLTRPRAKEFFKINKRPSKAEVEKTLDEQRPVEALANYISLSLRSIDSSIDQIAEHYHEQLVNHMEAGRVYGERHANTLSQEPYAHVHSFFLHLGAVRDYLGALIAHRIGLDARKVDSMARLVEELRQATLPKDALLDLLIESGNISAHPQKPSKFAVAGWMQEVTAIRNELVHKRPYGAKSDERWGWVLPTQKESGLYRYFRPLSVNGSAKQDLLDVLHHHYARCTSLLYSAAKASGNNAAMMHITDEDVISFKVRKLGKNDN